MPRLISSRLLRSVLYRFFARAAPDPVLRFRRALLPSRGGAAAAVLVLLALLVFPPLADTARSQDRPEMASYYDQAALLSAPAASFREGLLGLANPAVPALSGNQLVGAWTTETGGFSESGEWAVLSSLGGLGAGVVRRTEGPFETTGYHLSLAGGSKAAAVGIGYQGFGGDATELGRYNRISVGTVLRPNRYLSLGAVGNLSVENDEREVVAEIGVRPLGTSRLTLFADAAWEEGQAIEDVLWSAGGSVEVVRGIDLVGRFFENETVTAGLRLELGRLGIGSQSRVDAEAAGGDAEYVEQVHRLRLGSPAPSAIGDALQEGRRRVDLALDGAAPYRGPRISFGEEGPRFYEALRTLRQAGESGRVRAVALDLAGFDASPEKAWELREAVLRAREAGTTVVAFLRDAGMTTVHLASAADRVVLDPWGALVLPGYALDRTYLAGTLDKLGIGFQEWRFFEYKSAAETLSRTDLSPADSLQRRQYVDDQYELAVGDIVAARPITRDSLERIINERVVLTAAEARRAGLVDTLARWDDRDDLLEKYAGREARAIDADALDATVAAARRWGQPPKVAIVYGIGPTSLESGIEAEKLRDTFEELKEDDDVAAIVFRVDSPGGSGLASDLVARELRAAAAEKPVVVTQGQVAASGGYWISAYADRILAGPNTVTGSIGVIGGWVYDDGFGEKTGLSTDRVQRGERAELFTGITLPVLGATLPPRPLTDEEIRRVEDVFRQAYTDFVEVVAEGRGLDEDRVREIGEGRIYSGLDGREAGLVDEIGGLAEAVATAREAAGLAAEDVEVTEVNPVGTRIGLGRLLPGAAVRALAPAARRLGLPGPPEQPEAGDAVRYLRSVLEHQPRPLVLLPPGYYLE
jgi:protease-4